MKEKIQTELVGGEKQGQKISPSEPHILKITQKQQQREHSKGRKLPRTSCQQESSIDCLQLKIF
jgi:hypothetical protein